MIVGHMKKDDLTFAPFVTFSETNNAFFLIVCRRVITLKAALGFHSFQGTIKNQLLET